MSPGGAGGPPPGGFCSGAGLTVTLTAARSSWPFRPSPGTESGSRALEEATSATVALAPGAAPVAASVSVAEAPAASVPAVHRPVPAA